MLQRYLIFALRVMIRDRGFTGVAVSGLVLGLAGCLLILNYVRYERSYDHWVPDAQRIHQLQTTWHEPGQPITASQSSPYPIREAFAAGFPQVEALTVARRSRAALSRDGSPLYVDVLAVDPAFFDIFPLPFVRGDRAGALPDTRSIVLSETEATKQFGTLDALGRTLTLGTGDERADFVVRGVVRDLPRNSSLRVATITRHDPSAWDGVPAAYKGWGSMGQQHYIKLRAGANARSINAALPAWEKRVIAPQLIDGRLASQADIMDMKLVPMPDVHLGEAQAGALTPGGDARILSAFVVVALLTLGMAVMNYVNLATARATVRAREVALRKVLGASRRDLVVQFMVESCLTVGIAVVFALALVELATPWLADWVDADLRIRYLGAGGMLMPALLLFAGTSLVGGLYPALYLSRFQPAQVLRANRSAETPGNSRLRTTLVVLQFAIAIALIVCTSIIYAQTRFVQTVDPGFRRDGLIQIPGAGSFAETGNFDAVKREMAAVPGVAAVGRTNLGVAPNNKSIQAAQPHGSTEPVSIGVYRIDVDFLATMDMRLLAGRAFGDRYADDRMPATPLDADEAERTRGEAALKARGMNVVVNRAAAALLGFARPEAAVGQAVKAGVDGIDLVPARIVGVVEDTRIRTARDAIEPLIFTYDPDRTNQIVVRYAAARPSDVMAQLGAVWTRFQPAVPFEGAFVEDLVAELYRGDLARAAMFAGFTLLAILIACLGLYSLAAFTTRRRTKEIGIRKVLGARVRDIVRLLAWQFSKPVVVANLIAWPVAWWAMRAWLNGFDLRMPLGPTPFTLAGLGALAIALATVAGQSIRVARQSPIHALRYE